MSFLRESGNPPQLWVDAYDDLTESLTVSYAAGCSTLDDNVYYGPLDEVSSYGYSGEVCSVGIGGSTSFSLPEGSFFFVIVGDDDSVEGSYGKSSAEQERPGHGSCGFLQDTSTACDEIE